MAKEREKAFLKNGSMLLEKLIATCNGKSIPIRNFSHEELKKATNNYDASLVIHRHSSKWYKGCLEERTIFIRNFEDSSFSSSDFVINEIAISAMMSAHKNVLKLIGCCLETQPPSVVYEFAANDSLADRIYISQRTQQQYEPMAWPSRLRIARETAHAISYLHTAFSRPIIHRDIKTQNIFLEEHDVAKLSDFRYSISIPQGETYVEGGVYGTYGFLCPEYVATNRTTEKADVYGFGMVLLELLTGKRIWEICIMDNGESVELEEYIQRHHNHYHPYINEIVDPTILAGEGGASTKQQLQAVLDLAFTCREADPEMRPTMVDVTKQLRRIERSIQVLF